MNQMLFLWLLACMAVVVLLYSLKVPGKLIDKANAAGFIVVYPNGTGTIQTWNAGQCCGYAMNKSVDNVKFIDMLIDKLTVTYKINKKRVYVPDT